MGIRELICRGESLAEAQSRPVTTAAASSYALSHLFLHCPITRVIKTRDLDQLIHA